MLLITLTQCQEMADVKVAYYSVELLFETIYVMKRLDDKQR